MPLLETKGAASAQGFGLTLQQATPVYIEEVFSTWLYTGNGSTQTITNGIDLSTKGGLVWCKYRNAAGQSHGLFDTARGASNVIYSNLTNAQASESGVTAFNTTGFSLGSNSGYNANNGLFVSWTFRKQPKFFDVVTWTGNGAGTRTIAHSLGSQPGAIFLKRTDASGAWAGAVKNAIANSYWAGQGSSTRVFTTEASGSDVASDGFVGWTSTDFKPTSFGFNGTEYNINGATYVAYLFAHNAGGFGLTGTDNVISCGSFTDNGSNGATITLGYEPQWVLMKRSSGTGNWFLADVMRGMPVDPSGSQMLLANLSDAESTAGSGLPRPSATGFYFENGSLVAGTYIYIAIRRGPMRTPTTGTSVFAPYVTSSLNNLYNAGFVTDWVLQRYAANTDGWYTGPRLIGNYYMKTETTAAELYSAAANWDSNTGAWNFNANYGLYMFRRAPGFFDVVCYTGTGVNRTVTHNLGVAPELMIIKARSSGGYGWPVYAAAPGPTQFAYLDDTSSFSANSTAWNDTAPTASVFTVGTGSLMNTSSVTYVAYLFASCPGVSKVGSYTGTGALQTINCGFTGGARFVLIKRTDSTGDWWVYDSARGITSGNDPYLFLNSAAAQVTGTNYVDTTSVGFQVTAAAPAGLNANGGSYIFLAVA